MMANTYSTSIASILLALLTGCVATEESYAKGTGAIDSWVQQYIAKDEKLLCQQESNGEYFFVARAGDRMKIGSRLDLSDARPNHAYMVVWFFQNEKDDYIATNVHPVTMRQEYVKNDGKRYAEKVEYQTVYLKESEKLRVTVEVKKCPSTDCDRQQTKDPEEKQYSIKLCEVPIKK